MTIIPSLANSPRHNFSHFVRRRRDGIGCINIYYRVERCRTTVKRGMRTIQHVLVRTLLLYDKTGRVWSRTKDILLYYIDILLCGYGQIWRPVLNSSPKDCSCGCRNLHLKNKKVYTYIILYHILRSKIRQFNSNLGGIDKTGR